MANAENLTFHDLSRHSIGLELLLCYWPFKSKKKKKTKPLCKALYLPVAS